MNIVWGNGVVGQATAYAFKIENFYDVNPDRSNIHDFDELGDGNRYFICVPTPTNDDGTQDLILLKDAIHTITLFDRQADIVVRSTVLPTTCRSLQNEFGVEIEFMPEFLTESTALQDAISPEFVIIGGDNNAKKKALQILCLDSDIDCQIEMVSLETAELVKYAMNTFFGTKVVLGNIFRDIAVKTNADYWMVKKLLEMHKWGSVNGWNPFYGNKRGFGGKCLPKDIKALSRLDNTGLLRKLLEVNDDYRKL